MSMLQKKCKLDSLTNIGFFFGEFLFEFSCFLVFFLWQSVEYHAKSEQLPVKTSTSPPKDVPSSAYWLSDDDMFRFVWFFDFFCSFFPFFFFQWITSNIIILFVIYIDKLMLYMIIQNYLKNLMKIYKYIVCLNRKQKKKIAFVNTNFCLSYSPTYHRIHSWHYHHHSATYQTSCQNYTAPRVNHCRCRRNNRRHLPHSRRRRLAYRRRHRPHHRSQHKRRLLLPLGIIWHHLIPAMLFVWWVFFYFIFCCFRWFVWFYLIWFCLSFFF